MAANTKHTDLYLPRDKYVLLQELIAWSKQATHQPSLSPRLRQTHTQRREGSLGTRLTLTCVIIIHNSVCHCQRAHASLKIQPPCELHHEILRGFRCIIIQDQSLDTHAGSGTHSGDALPTVLVVHSKILAIYCRTITVPNMQHSTINSTNAHR